MAARLLLAPLAWLGPGRTVEDAAVLVEGTAVAWAGRRAEAPPVDDDTEIVQLDGFLMPAVADRHVHVGLSSPRSIVEGGVTAVRDLGWPPDAMFPLADASEGPSFLGPLIRACGPMLTAAGGYPTRAAWAPPGTGLELQGPEHAAGSVAVLAARGAAHVKVSLNAEAGPTPSDAELSAVVEAARRHGLPVTAHVQGVGQADRALGAGIAELAHAPWTERLPDDLLHAMARAGMRIVSTLDIQGYGTATPELRVALDNLRRFHAAGGEVAYGTDLGNGPIPPGIHVTEALLLAEAGLSTDEVIGAMSLGRLSSGSPADLVVVGGNPLEWLNAFDDLRLVLRGGRVMREGEVLPAP
jgi:imidazolonepropionase-like amidohydrolase